METIVLVLLSIAAAGLVLGPLVRRVWSGYDWDGTGEAAAERIPAVLAAEVDRYREALRKGTLCTRCGQANPPDSRFCGECGRPLAGAQGPS